jgi:hypothetical protein
MSHKPFNPRQFCFLVGLSASWAISSSFSGLAGEPLYLITHNTLHTLAIGTILSTNRVSTQFQPHLTITGQQLHAPISIHHDRNPLFSPGDKVIVSIRPEGWNYRFDSGAFQVSSLNPRTLKILKGALSGGALLSFQWYINTCGQEKEFSYSGSRYFVRQLDGKSLPIAKNLNKEWVPLRKANPSEKVCSKLYVSQQSSQIFSIIPWLIGMVALLGGTYLAYRIFKLRFAKP